MDLYEIFLYVNLIIGIIGLIYGIKSALRCSGKLKLKLNLINTVILVLVIKQGLKIINVLVSTQGTVITESLDTLVLLLLMFSKFTFHSLIKNVDSKYSPKKKL